MMRYRVVKCGRSRYKVRYRTNRWLPIWHDAAGDHRYTSVSEAGDWAALFRSKSGPDNWGRPIEYKESGTWGA